MKKGIIIDINTLYGIPNVKAYELMHFWRTVHILLYDGKKGNKPMLVDKEQGVLVDVSKLPEADIKELVAKLKTGEKLSI